MNPRILAAAFLALAALLGAKLTALLLFAFAVLVIGVHLLPLLTVLAIGGTLLFLLGRIAEIFATTGLGIVPCRKVVYSW